MRMMSGRLTLTIVREADQEVIDKPVVVRWKDEPVEKSREINIRLLEAVLRMAKGNLFGEEFNPGANKDTGTVEIHLNSKAKYDDGQQAWNIAGEWDDCDSVEADSLTALLESLK